LDSDPQACNWLEEWNRQMREFEHEIGEYHKRMAKRCMVDLEVYHAELEERYKNG
jgi:hypothetical protein